MWLKLAVSAAVIAFCVFLGYLAAEKYRKRNKFYQQFCEFNARYLTELSYERKPLGDFLKEFPAGGDFKKLFGEFYDKREASVRCSYLSAEEKKASLSYLQMLGRGDALSQKGYFEMQKPLLEEKKAKCGKEAKERGELYLKLGLLAGLAIVILIV